MVKIRLIILLLVAMSATMFIGCQATGGSIAGKVTNSLTGKPVAGVTVIIEPPLVNASIQTDAGGTYSVGLPAGNYTLTFSKENFEPATETVILALGQKVTLDVALLPVAVVVDTGKDQVSEPGGSVTLKVMATPQDGSEIKAYEWSQDSGATAILENAGSDSTKVTLGGLKAYKQEFINNLKPEDRFTIQAINPHVLMAAQTTVFRVTVTTTSGNYSNTVGVIASLPFAVSSGVADVPVGLPVLVHGKSQASYNWSLTSPSGSGAALDGVTEQYLFFTPDAAGKYTVSERNSGVMLDIYAGTWAGAITGQDSQGYLLAAGCVDCHNGSEAPDKFTPWKMSNHAAIFTHNLNTSTLYSESCFVCHTVGFDKRANNSGFDNAADYQAFLNSGMLGKPNSKNWANMLTKYPQAAKLTNVQCESCHGPNNGSTSHPNANVDAARTSISSDVCATCHVQPQGYGRLQEWQQSSHANFGPAISEATVESRGATAANCGRCHSGQGFLTWINQGDLTEQIQGASGNATMNELKSLGLSQNSVQPQTCATCHDPHELETTLDGQRIPNVRIMRDTGLLPSGYQARYVGYGALCITCHNTRNGPHNDANPPSNYSSPHTAAQGDVLMGENAYFVSQSRSSHSFIRDTCITCHMNSTSPPANLSYEPSGMNHSFQANLNVCASCHGDRIDPNQFKATHQAHLTELAQKMGDYLIAKLPSQIIVKDVTPHEYTSQPFDIKSNAVTLSKDNIVSAEPTDSHGQQGFLLKLRDPVDVTYAPAGAAPHTISVNEVQFQMGDLTVDGKTPLIPATDVLVKVGWNYHLIHYDGSSAIHNPAWVIQVLDTSINTIVAATNAK